jgi:hypothetical protein
MWSIALYPFSFFQRYIVFVISDAPATSDHCLFNNIIEWFLFFASVIILIKSSFKFQSSPIHHMLWLSSHEKNRWIMVSSTRSSQSTHYLDSTWKFFLAIRFLVLILFWSKTLKKICALGGGHICEPSVW